MRKILNKKQRGQIIILMMFAIIPIVLLMSTIFNGGYLLAQKTRLQNATDTSALMEASWTARSLNIMSMNNTALTQAQAITSAGWALEKPLMDAGLNSGLVAGFYVGRAFRIATLCGPWCAILAPLVYGAMLGAMNDQVMKPLYELQLDLTRAMHTDEDTGFAKAATSFGRMNKILAEEFPDTLEAYSDQLLHANFSDSATLMRYTAWADDPLNSGDVQLPVVEQSFRDAMAHMGIADNDSSSTTQDLDQNTETGLTEAIASIKDIRDVYKAGLDGTITNPYSSLDLNYFGNFRAQGYVDGTGPFNAARGELETEFETIYTDLEGYIDGSAVGDAIGNAVASVIPGGFIGRIIRKIVRKIVSAIFTPLAATAYESQETNPEDLAKRLTEVWEWSSLYSETHYSNSWRVDAKINLILFDIFAPPRAWRGIAPGIYHGRDLSNIGGSGGSYSQEDAEAAAAEGKRDYVNECAGWWRVSRRENQLSAAERRAKGLRFDQMTSPPYNSDTGRPYTRSEYIRLTSAEQDAVDREALRQVREECTNEYDALQGGPNGPDPTALPGETNEEVPNEESYADTHGDGSDSGGSGSWNRPIPLQNYLEMVNWFFEPAYKAISLPFPADAALFAFIGPEFLGGDRNTADPNWWCGMPFGEGFVCTNEAPLYAVNRQRIIPQFALDIVADVGLNVNSLPDAIRDNYLADRDDWSLVIAAYAPAELLLAGNGFGSVPAEMSTISQAEVYNSQWFDLFTQTWKAKLTPIAILDDDDHYAALTGEWHQENVDLVEPLRAARHADERVLNH